MAQMNTMPSRERFAKSVTELETANVPLSYRCTLLVELRVSLISDLNQVMSGCGLAPSTEQVSVSVLFSTP